MYYFIASFDIGKKNFAFCVERFISKKIEDINSNSAPKNEQLSTIYNNGEIVLLENLNLTKNCDNSYLDPQTFINMTETLDNYKEYWEKCHVFLIEQQMSFRGKRNTMALKLGQHCFSYFSILYKNSKKIIEFPAYHKTQVLDAPKKFGKN